ncbi:MAG: CAP domain-containing protein [bacterium]|nr:CAP domain-containing protein [bacterium]
MIPELALLTVLLTTPAPVCGADADEPLRHSVLSALNRAREQTQRPALQPHPALCETARWRASGLASTGVIESTPQTYSETNRRIYRAGYKPHHWTETTFIGPRADELLSQWRELQPESWAQAVQGDFEDVGIGLGWHESRPVWSIVLALGKRTVEWRRAEPLRDLERVRAVALEAVNRFRHEKGRRQVVSDPRLDTAAQQHAADMLRRAYYSHRSPEGHTVQQRTRAAGYREARVVGENIAKGLFAPEEVVRRWLESYEHRRNILLHGATHTGLGVAFGESPNGFEVVWVQVFAGRR